MSSGYPWTDKQVAKLCDLLAIKITQRQIALILGCTVCAVESKLHKMRDADDQRLPKRARRRVWKGDKSTLRHTAGRPLDFVATPIAPRDPCFRCGVRRDIGCEHTAWEKAA